MLTLSQRTVRFGILAGLALVTLLLTPRGDAQRLPHTVRPEHYTLTLTPDLKNATFKGAESIDVLVEQPTSTVTLNSVEIKYDLVFATLGGKGLAAKVTLDPDKQQATLDFGQKLPPGKLKINIIYSGILNGQLRGFYLSKTAKRNYAVTQFEATDARRAFPSFDEPAMKATFDITLVVDQGDTAISNTNIVRDEPVGSGEKHAIKFAVTPKMSTYLVAFLVGDFECLSGSSDGVPIRACATPDQVQYGKFALSTAEYVLHYYDTYFGIKYPMPKLDMIALPDFEAGAMENFGAITYRETDLLLDADRASLGAQKQVGLVVAHEMAHQWFGDMVTMEWWDNLWLNEGFASWMENKPIEAWKPEWKISEAVSRDTQATLNLDAQRVTRTIRAKADTPEEINEMFDGISYGKAGAVLLMVENYLGEETFRQGVHKYLSAHLYGNATAEDFWTAQTEVSHKPVDKIMASLVAQPGEPIIAFGPASNGKASVTQRRFFLNAKGKVDQPETWTFPICFKSAEKARCELLSQPSQTIAIPSTPLLYANAGGKGYYRSSYPPEAYRALLTHAETSLTPEERISLIGDQWAQVRAGQASIESYLDLNGAISGDSSADVIGAAIANLAAINNRIISNPEERSQFSAWVRAHFSPAYRKLGEPTPNDAPELRELRAELLALVGGLGEDPEVIAQAKVIAVRSLADPESVDATFANPALAVAARNGDPALFDQLQKISQEAVNPQQREGALHALALFRDPALVQRALTYAVSGQVRNQDVVSLLAIELQGTETREVAWQFIQNSFDKVMAQVTTDAGSGLVGSTGSFCSTERRDEIASFFGTHKVPSSARALARAKDQISDCVDLRSDQEPSLKAWLAKQ